MVEIFSRFIGKKSSRIYLDYASATPCSAEAMHAYTKALTLVGNPGSVHAEGVEAMRALTAARESVAAQLGVKAREVIFTSGLTEANNLAILGFARNLLVKSSSGLTGTHWVVSAIEHSSVLECFSEIERLGGEVTHINPDHRGVIAPEVVARALRKETVFVSIGWANNEIGTIQPLAKIARIIREHEAREHTHVALHSDAGEAPLYISTSAHSLGVDMLTIGCAKLYGPHGVGALWVNNRTELAPVILGGAQERGLRAGTENVALAAGFAAGFERVVCVRKAETERVEKLRDNFARKIIARIPEAVVNGDLKHALPHMLNISIPNINAEYLVLALDHAGIALSTKSACKEGEKSSHVVEALGGEAWRAENTLRFSLGMQTTERDLEYVADTLFHLYKSTQF